MPRRSPSALSALLLSACLVLTACTAASSDPNSSEDPGGPNGRPSVARAALTMPATATAVAAGTAAPELAIATSKTLFAQSSVAVVAQDGDLRRQALAAAAAVHLGVPLLLAPSTPAESASSTTGASTDTPAATSTESTAGGAMGNQTGSAADLTALTAELTRLGTTTVLDVGSGLSAGDLGAVRVVPAPDTAAPLFAMLAATPGVSQVVTSAGVIAAVAALDPAHPAPIAVSDAPPGGQEGGAGTTASPSDEPSSATVPAVEPAEPLALTVLATPDVTSLAATATARAAGATVVVAPNGDPRTSHETIATLAAAKPANVLGLGSAFGTADSLGYRVSVAVTGVELPGGGQVVFPGRRMVALYGNPTTAALGVLGEQPLPQAIERAKQMAAPYVALWSDQPVVPAFELIATVASAFPGPDKNYSTEMTVDDLRPWVEGARDAGVYVVLDLQPGRTDFLTQAKIFEPLLKEPNVGLALDPEWRLGPNQVHLVQIGTVTAAEINTVVEWLADLTHENQLPQKIFMLHQFRLSMISDRSQVDTSRDELAVLIHADGNGPPGSKENTYNALTANPPPNVWWGWKNFIDEDSPMFTPEQTVAVRPEPVFVSYQ